MNSGIAVAVANKHARYLGSRKNEFDLRRAGAVSNLEVIQRRLEDSVVLDVARAATRVRPRELGEQQRRIA